MAATRLIALHVNKGKTVAQCLNEWLDYSQNPIKTEKGELISSYACDPETAAMEFLLSKRQYQQVTGQEYEGNIIAYQIRQSFKPGEITPEEALKEKISRANVRESHRRTQQPGIDLLIDIQNRALGKGARYERWAKSFNLKQTAKTLLFLQQHDIHSYEELERMTNEAVAGADRLLASIKEKDARIKEIEALRQHIFDYSKTRKTYLEYKRLPKAKKAEFYELHRAEIELQEAARAAFDQLPEGTKLPTVKELCAERTRLIQERQTEYAEYRKVKADRTEFIRAKQNADVILSRQQEERDEKSREK